MKHNWKVLLLSAVLCTAALLGVACGTSPELEPFQGHWVDINSDAALDFSGDTMTLTSYGSEVYTVKVESGQVVNAKNQREQFGIMGSLYIEDDGSLTAYEQILDAEGHHYRFVREEDKEKALVIRDTSEDLPQLNGYSMRNEVDRDGYSLSVTYESGEQLRISAKGDAATACVFDLPALLDHAQKQPIRQF